MSIKRDITAIAGLVATASLTVVTGGLANPAVTSIAAGLAANFIGGFTPAKIKKWFVTVHPDKLNHSIKKLFVASVNEALNHINILFLETNHTDKEKKAAKQLIKDLQKKLPDILMDTKKTQLEEDEIKRFLYEQGKEETVSCLIDNQFAEFGITEPFKSFLATNLPAQIQLCFGEGLKDPANHNAWVAFQRMLMEEMRNDIKQVADVQQSIKDDLSDLKFTKSGFSKKQIDEIHELVSILNNKKLVEVKIKGGIDQSLQSIENKANEIIRITTETNLTVSQLKVAVEKQNRQNKINQLIIISLAGCLLIASAFIGYKLLNQPFTATVQVYGWEGKQHNPLDGKGMLVLTLGDKTEKAEISHQGEAIFKDVPPQYKDKSVAVRIEDTENEPYYLTDSTIQIHKGKKSEIQVRLRGLERLQGIITDEFSEEGLPDVSVTVAGVTVKTDEKGKYNIDIPVEKQRLEQEIEVSKEGYKSKRQTIPMSGDNKHNIVLIRR